MHNDELTPEEFFQRAASRFRKEDFYGAEAYCTEAIQAGLNTADVYYLRAKTRQVSGNAAGAVDDYTMSITLDPHHAMAYERRGSLRLVTGDAVGAQQDLQKAIEVYPDYHPRVWEPVETVLWTEYQIPFECRDLWLRCVAYHEARIHLAQTSGDLQSELVHWKAFVAIGAKNRFDSSDIEHRMKQLERLLNIHC